MAKKREDSNTRKAKGIWHLETRQDYVEQYERIPKKTWADITGMDLYRLFEKNWKMADVSQKWNVSSIQIINRLRRS